VLLGVASPSNLISDPTRTPFNIGIRIDLTDFTFEEALPLARGLESDDVTRKATLSRVLYWTGGHPYLMQKVCLRAAESASDVVSPMTSTGSSCRSSFAAGSDRRDGNLNFVHTRVEGRADLTRRMLAVYERVLDGREVKDDPASPILTELKLAGLVKVGKNGELAVRNEIYKRAFGERWIRKTSPPASERPTWHRSRSCSCYSSVG